MSRQSTSPTGAPEGPRPRPYASIVSGLGLASLKSGKVNKSKARAHASQISAANDDTIPESSRNNTLASLAGSMRRKGMGTAAIEAALQQENQDKCKPPLDPSEVANIANSIGRYAPATSDDVLKTLNDTGNAQRFAHKHHEDAMYVFGMGWFHWREGRWQADTMNQVQELAKAVAKDIFGEAAVVDNDDVRMHVLRHARASLQAPRLKASLELAQSIPGLVATTAELDSHDMLLGVANGVIDLKTGKLKPTQRTDLLTRHSAVAFDTKARCPVFDVFINEVTGGDRKLAAYLQQVVGYALSGDTSEQCLFFLYGSGRNGKSTFANVVIELLGPQLSRRLPTETLMIRRAGGTSNDLARLHSVRVAVANEIEQGSQLAEALVKQFTGGESVSARFLYQEHFDFMPKFKLFICGNHKPVIQGRDDGIWRRIRLVPFEVSIPQARCDPKLMDKLRAELPGILNWAIKGCLAWQRRGLSTPQVVNDAVSGYRDEMDLIGQWIADCAETSSGHEWRAGDAYQSYRMWAESNGYKPMSNGNFGRDIASRFHRAKRNNGNYLIGLGRKRTV